MALSEAECWPRWRFSLIESANSLWKACPVAPLTQGLCKFKHKGGNLLLSLKKLDALMMMILIPFSYQAFVRLTYGIFDRRDFSLSSRSIGNYCPTSGDNSVITVQMKWGIELQSEILFTCGTDSPTLLDFKSHNPQASWSLAIQLVIMRVTNYMKVGERNILLIEWKWNWLSHVKDCICPSQFYAAQDHLIKQFQYTVMKKSGHYKF